MTDFGLILGLVLTVPRNSLFPAAKWLRWLRLAGIPFAVTFYPAHSACSRAADRLHNLPKYRMLILGGQFSMVSPWRTMRRPVNEAGDQGKPVQNASVHPTAHSVFFKSRPMGVTLNWP